jgi:hypothetical protein
MQLLFYQQLDMKIAAFWDVTPCGSSNNSRVE